MKIDWFTLIAQLINFFVLMWLLKTFLFGKILQAMKEREESISSKIAEAEQLQSKAAAEVASYRLKSAELDSKRESLIAKATAEAEGMKSEILDKVQRDAAKSRKRWTEELEVEQSELMKKFRIEIGKQVLRTSDKLLRDIADTDLEMQISHKFSSVLKRLSESEKSAIIDGMRGQTDPLRFLTSFELDNDAQTHWRQLLQGELGDSIAVEFGKLSDDTFGFEIRTASHRIPWSLESHLDGIESRVIHALKRGEIQHA